MTLRNQVLVWVGFFLVLILLLWLFSPILLPFVIGLALAYLLNPLVNLLVRIGIGRAFASLLVLILVLAIIVGLLLMLVPLVTQQVLGLIAGLPQYISDLQLLIQRLAPQLAEWLGPAQAAQLQDSLSELLGRGVEIAGGFTAQLAQSGLTVINTIAVLVITPVVAFYLLLDWEGMIKRADDLLPRRYRKEIRGVVKQIDRSMAGVLRGVGGVVLVLSVFYASALWMVGLDFGLAIGVIGGVMSFIPYVGFLIGFTLSLTVAAVQFWPDEWLRLVIVLVIYIVGQFLEGNVLYPKLVGQSININPVWLMFALFAFGLLFGFVGLLLAVPLAAMVGVLTRYALRKYQASSLYSGDTTVAEEPAPVPVTSPAPPSKPAAKRRPARR